MIFTKFWWKVAHGPMKEQTKQIDLGDNQDHVMFELG